jgi:AraC-like DNA-binding protein
MESYLERAAYIWSKDSLRLINTPSSGAKALFFYVQECGHFKTRPSYFTERANLNSLLLLYTLSGEGTLRILDDKDGEKDPGSKKRQIRLQEGSLILLDCRFHHCYSAVTDWEFLWIHLYGNGSLGYADRINAGSAMPAVLHPSDPAWIRTSMENVIRAVRTGLPSVEPSVNGTLCMLLSRMITDRESVLSAGHTDALHTGAAASARQSGFSASAAVPVLPDYIRTALDYLDRHFKEPVTLSAVAKQAGISPCYLSREFRSRTGTTVREYLISSRLNYAKELLRYEDRSIEEVCFACGMNEVSHFIALFRAREGMTPLCYRRRWRG